MNKTELIAAVAEKAGIAKKDAEKAVNATLDAITETMVAGDKVQLVGFGTFETRRREARTGRNPRHKEAFEIPASTVPAFKPGKALTDPGQPSEAAVQILEEYADQQAATSGQ